MGNLSWEGERQGEGRRTGDQIREEEKVQKRKTKGLWIKSPREDFGPGLGMVLAALGKKSGRAKKNGRNFEDWQAFHHF